MTPPPDHPDGRRRAGSACCSSTSARPTRPSRAAVRRYLAEFLSDPRVIEIPQLVWKPILHGGHPAHAAGEIGACL